MSKLKELSDHLRTWLDRYKQAADIAPTVQKAAEEVDWQLRTVRDRPTEAANVSTEEIEQQASLALDRVKRELPQIPVYISSSDLRIYASTTSSSSVTSLFISRIADIGTPATEAYATEAIESYRQLQESHQRMDRVKQLIDQRFSNLISRFASAEKAYQQYRTETGQSTAAAFEMRNLLDGLKGEAFARARKNPRENMTWSTMSDRLGSDVEGRSLLRNQESVRSTLYNDLSNTGKRRGPAASIEALWGRTLDHLLVVLSETQ